MKLTKVYIGLGSNLDDPETQVNTAIKELAQHPDFESVRASSLYRSKPLADMDQPDYLNAVVELITTLSPAELLSELQAIEDLHQRDRTAMRWGARTLDLDILLYGQEIIATETLTIPHYGLRERNFVLVPLAELDPELKLPDNSHIADLVEQCSTKGLIRIE